MATHEIGEEEEQVTYARLYADSAGKSHFADESLPLETAEVPGAPPFVASEALSADDVMYAGFEPGYSAGEHPTAFRSFCLVLSGEMELTASDGEVRTFSPGSFLLMEDTTGKGHAVEFPSDDTTLCALVLLGG